MEIKVSTFIFILLYTVNCKPSDPSDFDMDGDYDMQNDNTNYGGEYDDPEEPEESKAVIEEKPLEITTLGQEFIRNLSDSVVLPCAISGSAFVRVWRKKNVITKNAEKADPVLFQESVRMAAAPNMKQSPDGSLEISNLHVQDAGEYECVAMGSAKNSPNVEHRVILRVPPQIEVLTSRDNITTLSSGDTLTLICKAKGYPKPTISWHKGSERLKGEGEMVQISNIKHHDAGTYKCLADNKIGEPAFSYINIKVEFKPVITIEQITVSSENNSETELQCLVHAEPRAAVVWSKDGVNIQSTERIQLISNEHKHNLILKDLRDSDFGLYSCSATNAIGNTKKQIKLVKTPAVVGFKSHTDTNGTFLAWEVQSKSSLSANELLYRKKGENQWTTAEPEVHLAGNDVYKVQFTKSLDPGDYETKLRSQNNNGWSEYSDVRSFSAVSPKHGHHKSHKKGHKHGKERQITPTTPTLSSQAELAENQENLNQSGFIKESPVSGTQSSNSTSVTPMASLISIALFIFLQMRLGSARS